MAVACNNVFSGLDENYYFALFCSSAGLPGDFCDIDTKVSGPTIKSFPSVGLAS